MPGAWDVFCAFLVNIIIFIKFYGMRWFIRLQYGLYYYYYMTSLCVFASLNHSQNGDAFTVLASSEYWFCR